MSTHNPLAVLTNWILEESQKGAPDPKQAVLSTAGKDGVPHGRIVAIREINEEGFLFFTQKGSRKVAEIKSNPFVSLTFWFELFEREVMIDGSIHALSEAENKTYWESYPSFAQIRFHSYAPTSSKTIPNKQFLEDKRKHLTAYFQDKPIPMSEDYCGFRIIPERIVFYTYRKDELSDVIEYKFIDNRWEQEFLSP